MDDSMTESPSSSINGNIYKNKMNNRSPSILQMAKNFVGNLKNLFKPPEERRRAKSSSPSESSNLFNTKKEDVYYNNHETFEISDIFNGNKDNNIEHEISETKAQNNDSEKIEETPKVSPYNLIKKRSNKVFKLTPPSKEENTFFSPMIIKKIDYNITPDSSNNSSSRSPYVLDSHLFSYRSPFKKKKDEESTPTKTSPLSNGTLSSDLRRKRKKIVKETKSEDREDYDEFDIMPIAKKKKHIETDFNTFRKQVLNKNLPSPKSSMGFLKDFQPFVNTFEDEFESPEEKLDAQLEKFLEIKKKREEMERKFLEKSKLLEEKHAKLLEEREKIEKATAEANLSSSVTVSEEEENNISTM